MPNAARLVAAILFAALSYWAGDLLRATLPESLPGFWLSQVAAALGLLFGWTMSGARAGAGYVASTGFALTTLGLIVFWGLVIFSGAEMIERSLRKFYSDPTEALEAMTELFVEYGKLLFTPEFLVPALIGTVFCGAVVEFVSHRTEDWKT